MAAWFTSLAKSTLVSTFLVMFNWFDVSDLIRGWEIESQNSHRRSEFQTQFLFGPPQLIDPFERSCSHRRRSGLQRHSANRR